MPQLDEMNAAPADFERRWGASTVDGYEANLDRRFGCLDGAAHGPVVELIEYPS
jgi:hypothetical protein